MKEIVVLSGKGGAGKTSLCASLVPWLPDTVFVDADVDSPNLHILLDPVEQRQQPYMGVAKAWIDPDRCIGSGQCQDACVFDAIIDGDEGLMVVASRCEGCGVCALVCSSAAVDLAEVQAGTLLESQSAYGTLVHGWLRPGEETSGKLIRQVRDRAKERAQDLGARTVLIDGPPGIGCNAMASLAQVDLVVLVTEPSPSGLHDLERLVALVQRFHLKATAVINKVDLSEKLTRDIEEFCGSQGIPVALELPFDERFGRCLSDRRIPSLALESEFRDWGFFDFIESLTKND